MDWKCQSTNCVPRFLEMGTMEPGRQQLGLLRPVICSGLFQTSPCRAAALPPAARSCVLLVLAMPRALVRCCQVPDSPTRTRTRTRTCPMVPGHPAALLCHRTPTPSSWAHQVLVSPALSLQAPQVLYLLTKRLLTIPLL